MSAVEESKVGNGDAEEEEVKEDRRFLETGDKEDGDDRDDELDTKAALGIGDDGEPNKEEEEEIKEDWGAREEGEY